MVSTHSQYLTDYNSPLVPTVDAGKSPLAMLAKTCETIGLPDTPNRKSTKEDKMKDNSHSPSNSSTSGESKKDELSPLQKKKEGSKSPRTTVHSPAVGKKTPITSEPSTSTAPLPTNVMLSQRAGFFPMAFSPLGGSFPVFPYPPMMPTFATMPGFPSGFPTTATPPGSYLRCVDPNCKGCPLMPRSCPTPGCVSCSLHSSVTTPTDMITAFPSPFFSTYNPLMTTGAVSLPPTSSSSAQLAYQNLMAAAASSQTSKHICNWPDTTGICGKTFNSADELASHTKASHTSAVASVSLPSSSAELKSSSPKTSTTALSSHPSLRYHPYLKPNGMLPNMGMPNPLGVPSPFTMPTFPTTVALQAMYAQQQQRLMANLPHP